MGSDEPHKVTRLRRPTAEPDVKVRPDLVDDSYWPEPGSPATRRQLRWFRTLRGYLTLHLDRRDLIPPEIYRLTDEDKALPPMRRDRYDRWHAHWMDRMLMRILEGEDPRIVFKLDKYFPGANTEQRDQNMALEVVRLLTYPIVLNSRELSLEQHVINRVADKFEVSEKVVRTARKTWIVTPKQLTKWIRTLKKAGELKP